MHWKSYALSIALRYILPKGVDWLEKYTKEKHDEVVQYLRDILWDYVEDEVIEFIETVLAAAFDAARAVLGDRATPRLVAAPEFTEPEVAKAVYLVNQNRAA